MIDLHCHLLPGIDDGSPDIDTALSLAKLCVENGITHAVCTPHIHLGHFDNNKAIIETVHREFSQALNEAGIPLHTHFAGEVRIGPEIVALYNGDKLPFLGFHQGKPVMLVELPHSHVPVGVERVIAWLKGKGITPMIAHPERNRDIIADYSKAIWLKSQGVLFQVTAGAIVGQFSQGAQDTATHLLDDGLADIVATDTHNAHKRPPMMKQAYEAIAQNYNLKLAQELCVNAPWEIAKSWFE